MTPSVVASNRPLSPTLRRAYRRVYTVPAWQAAVAVGALIVAAIVAAALSSGRPLNAIQLVLAVLLSAATVTDLLWKRIFHWVPGGILAGVIVQHAFAAAGSSWTGVPSMADSAVGFGVCGGLMLAFYVLFRGGEGDVKLIAVLGAALGPWHGLETVMFGYLLAAVVAVGTLAAWRRSAGTPPRTMPMAPFFALGVLITLSLPMPQ